MPDAPCRHAISWFEIPLCDLERAEALHGLACGQPRQRRCAAAATIAAVPRGHEALDHSQRIGAAEDDARAGLNAARCADGRRIALPSFAHVIHTDGHRAGLRTQA